MIGVPDTGFRWNRLECSGRPVNLGITLSSGQSFRWRTDERGVWWGVLDRTVLAAWQEPQSPDSPLYWQTFPDRDRLELVSDYFRLDVDLEALAAEWVIAEPRMESSVGALRGLRVLRQPPEECFFAFLCATCNTVTKIERSVRRLAERYGEPLVIDSSFAPFPFFRFPTTEALANADEADLRADLWGYRAPRLIALAQELSTRPAGWLESLRRRPYREARSELSSLFGVGAKLADCICLFSLDKDEAVPIDTHVHRIAVEMFAPEFARMSLTPRVYEILADSYRACFRARAGWAQQYLFFADLRRAHGRR